MKEETIGELTTKDNRSNYLKTFIDKYDSDRMTGLKKEGWTTVNEIALANHIGETKARKALKHHEEQGLIEWHQHRGENNVRYFRFKNWKELL